MDGMNVALQTVWHQAYERALETITSLRNHCDFKYERDSKNAKEVKIFAEIFLFFIISSPLFSVAVAVF